MLTDLINIIECAKNLYEEEKLKEFIGKIGGLTLDYKLVQYDFCGKIPVEAIIKKNKEDIENLKKELKNLILKI